MNLLMIYGYGGVAILVFVVVVWLLSVLLKRSDIIDVAWSVFFLLSGSVYAFSSHADGGWSARSVWVMILLWAWGVRLAVYLGWRTAHKSEDFRYRKWREENGSQWWWRSLYAVYLLQAGIAWGLSTPFLLALAESGTPLHFLDGLAVVVWLVGFAFETGGDWQLMRFKANPANKGLVLPSGFWRYTRHPNYFGDAMQWWGFYLFALANGGWWTVYAPAIMTFFLVRVSGVALLEEHLQRKPGYAEYVARTSAFLPRLPKREQSR